MSIHIGFTRAYAVFIKELQKDLDFIEYKKKSGDIYGVVTPRSGHYPTYDNNILWLDEVLFNLEWEKPAFFGL
jgi:hypothetical protein